MRNFHNLYTVEIVSYIIRLFFLRYKICDIEEGLPMKNYLLRTICMVCLFAATLSMTAQERKPMNKPYIDLRPLHFGILVGTNFQDVDFDGVGPQTITLEDGTIVEQTIATEADKWNPGFSVGVLAEGRLSNHLALRFTPTMHFGAKHLVFRNLTDLDQNGEPRLTTQDLKNTYLALPVNFKFSAQRFNNYRPYITAGINPMINLTHKDQDYIQLKRYDVMVEVGLGCDFYLPFFKLNPELKFCYSLMNSLDTKHADEIRDANMRAFTNSVSSAHTKMFVLTFYFE